MEPMEQEMPAEQVERILDRNADSQYLVFPEGRSQPIRWDDILPACWEDGPASHLRGEARPGEYFAFQLGVFAARAAIDDIEVSFSDLVSDRGGRIASTAAGCINTGGRDWAGRPVDKTVSVPQGKVQPLWCGIAIPEDAEGLYEGTVTVRPTGGESTEITLLINVQGDVIEEHGDNDLWRYSRIRWLDSDLALDDEVVAPYTPLQVKGRRIACLGREVQVTDAGLPQSVESFFTMEMTGIGDEGRPLLARPAEFVVETDAGPVAWSGGAPEFRQPGPAKVVWESTSKGGPFEMHVAGEMEQEGFLSYKVQLKALEAGSVRDIRLELPLEPDAAVYAMGMGKSGGFRPQSLDWKWDQGKHQDGLWVGDINVGVRCRLKGPNYRRPYVNLYYSKCPLLIPEDWDNQGRGGCRLAERDSAVAIEAYSGPRDLEAGEVLNFHFELHLTPFRPIDPAKRFAMRYYHGNLDVDRAAEAGATVMNIHHGNEVNPWINYPFLTIEKLAEYVRKGHDHGMKVKYYYTVRELSNKTVELWALRSLGGEILAHGEGEGVPGQGGADEWLVTHLRKNYVPAWKHVFGEGDGDLNGQVDASLLVTSLSRWHNYYLEGLDYLLRHVEMDGIYVDDTSYDREVMKRVRKILDRGRPGSLIDFHTCNHFQPSFGTACCLNLYMELLPFIDSTWIGEGRNYNTPPDYWMVEIASIPYGLMGEMLDGGGNPWRGMVYGMTARLPWSGNPVPLWQLWDAFGIEDARMIGCWAPTCPVQTGRDDVLATVYRRDDRSLISLASWADDDTEVRLEIDWEALGIDPAKAIVRAPAVENFQDERAFPVGDPIPMPKAKGWLLWVEESR